VNPSDSFLFANRIGDPIEGITADSVDPFHAGLRKGLDD
jgi:hypothetical protein